MTITHNWLWIDLETTGLDEGSGQILEIAAAVVDDGPTGTFEIVDSIDTVVLPLGGGFQQRAADPRPLMDPYVVEMHTKNGLLAEIDAGRGMALAEADDMFRAFVDQMCDGANTKIILAGGSVHFDLRWVKRHMPRLAHRLHYRVFDVSTLKAVARVWGPGFEDIKLGAHRALADVKASIAEAKAYRGMVLG